MRLVAATATLALMMAGAPAAEAAGPAVVTPPAVSFGNTDIGLGRADQIPDPAGKPIRIEVSWWAVQDKPTWPYDWSRYDAQIERAAAAGMKILLLITYAPPWSNGHGTSDKWFPLPQYDTGWATFVHATVRRYGDRVKAYEIWNEPNHLAFGNYGGNTDEERRQRYWDLVRLSNATIKAACPACLVLAGGSAAGTPERGDPPVPAGAANPNAPAAWLDWAYRHGYGEDFDAVAHHPYPIWNRKEGPVPAADHCGRPDRVLFGADYRPGKPYQQQCGQLGALRAVLVDNGDADRRIWGTEWGYPTASGMGAAHPSLESIRDFDVQGVHLWRQRDHLGPLFLYQFQDSCTDPVEPECHYGIVDPAGVPKEPLYSDLIAMVAGSTPAFLPAGQSLRRWQALRSPNGRFTLAIDGDGRLAVHDRGTPIWTAAAAAPGRRLINQNDGNLVLYADPDRPVAVWSNGRYRTAPGPLWMQDDGNLVRYDGAGKPIWASGTVVAPPAAAQAGSSKD